MVKHRFNRFLVLVTIFALVFTFVPFNSKAANPISLTEQDFVDSIDTPGVATSKGIIYNDYLHTFDLLPNSYIFAEDIDFGEFRIIVTNDGVFILDLNNKTLHSTSESPLITFNTGKVTITGNGKVESGVAASMSLYNCEATVVNGTFDKMITSGADEGKTAKIVIEDATCKGVLVRGEGAELTINSGTYEALINSAVQIVDGASIVINDGTFISGVETLVTQTDYFKDPTTGEWYIGAVPKSVTINGGTFTCTGEIPEYSDDFPKGALFFYDCEKVVLNGGTFNSSDNSYGGIVILSNDDAQSVINSFLGNGYSYNEPLSVEEKDVSKIEYYNINGRKCYASQKNISVVKASQPDSNVPDSGNSDSNNSDDNSKVKPPKTGDIFLSWIFDIIGVIND